MKLSSARAPSHVLAWLRRALRDHPEFGVVFDAKLADVYDGAGVLVSATAAPIASPWGTLAVADVADRVIGTLGRDLALRGLQAPIAAGIL